MIGSDALAVFASVAVAYLLLVYAFSGPVILVRTLVAAVRRRRARYRGHADEVLATSRFTVPVTIVLPATGTDVADAVENLLAFHYPELEVVVVVGNDGTRATLERLRTGFALRACEIFYRRSLPTGPVRAIYRSGRDPRLLVVDATAASRGEALNCGVNLARYRYVCCADQRARYQRHALLTAMQPASDDPAAVVGVTTALAGGAEETPDGLAASLQRLSALRSLLGRGGSRRLSLAPEGRPGFTIWRRDALLEMGGFATDLDAEHLELTFRVHRHMRRAGQPYRIVHVSEPVGTLTVEPSLAAGVEQRLRVRRDTVRILWRSRGMILNPAYGRVGLLDVPRFLLATTVVPWFELACLLVLPFAAALGVVSTPQLLLVVLAVGLGNALLLDTAMLLAPRSANPQAMLALVLLGPVDVYLSRPAELYSRLTGLLLAFRTGQARTPPAA